MKLHTIVAVLTSLIISIFVSSTFAQNRNWEKVPAKSKLEVQPLNVKPGLWETTTTYKRSGAPPISSDALARLTPEQRARLEQRMSANSGSSTNTITDKHCVTKEDVEKADFGQGQGECTYNVETSTSSHGKGTYSCLVEGIQVNGAMDIIVADSEHINGSSHGSLNGVAAP